MAQLYVVECADFLFLQNQLQMTPGNLSSHLSKLEEAEYVEIVKEFIERKPHKTLKQKIVTLSLSLLPPSGIITLIILLKF